MDHHALRKSIFSLSHPLTILAVIVLLVNDHLLRIFWPSWITGKVGDFSWLVFAPLMLAVPLSILIPRSTRNHERVVGISSIAIVATVFVLAKTMPTCHAMTNQLIEAVLGWPSTLKRDPTDLMALPALLVSWHIWRRNYECMGSIVTSRGWVVLALATLATVANTPAPADMGITCLYEDRGDIIAPSFQGNFISQDGGLSWRSVEPQESQWDWCEEWDDWDCCFMNTLVLEGQEEVQYRLNPGRSIERTEDGGQSWEVEFALSHHTEAQSAAYLIKHSEFNPWILGGPIEAITHAGSGNIIVSMGLEGILVRTEDGEWRWVSVGPYERIEPQSSQVYTAVLTDEFVVAAILVILLLGTTIRHVERRIPKELLFTAVVWLMWVWLIQAVKEDTYSAPFIDLDWLFIDLGLLPLTAILSLILLIRKSTVDFYKRSPRAFLAAVLSSFVGGILFLVPYILWIQNSLPKQSVASNYAMFIGFGMLLATFGIARGFLKKESSVDAGEESAQEGES